MKHLSIAVGLTLATLVASHSFAATKPVTEIAKASSADVSAVHKVNINSATVDELDAIPGLGKKKAQAVVDYIAQNGPIKDQAQLTQIKGIGDKLAAKISPYLSFQ